MSHAPSASAAQLASAVKRAREKDAEATCFVIRANPDASAPQTRVGDDTVTVLGTNSPLEIRFLLQQHPAEMLVVVTELDDAALGDDVRERIATRGVITLDRWLAVQRLFGVNRITRDLAKKAYLADALIETEPLNGYRPLLSGVLDTETALARLLEAHLDIPADANTLTGLIVWASVPERAHRLGALTPQVGADIDAMLRDRFGPGAQALKSIVVHGHLEDVSALAIVAGVLHHPEASNDIPAAEARVRLANHVGSDPGANAWEDFGRNALSADVDPDSIGRSIGRAEALLDELGGSHLAHLSDLVPLGFEQRMTNAARQLANWKTSGTADDGEAADRYVRLAGDHRRCDTTRVRRLQMAQRLIRREDEAIEWGSSLQGAAATYRTNVAWLDWARTFVSRSDSNATVAALYTELIDAVDPVRHEANRTFAQIGAQAGGSLPDGVIGVENVLSELIGPLAADVPVLLLVLDGMGWESFVDLHEHLARRGWSSVQPPGRTIPAVVATLPTVTEYSRTSLLAGVLRRGTGESEKRAFAENPGLLAVSDPTKPPIVHHKAELRDGGIDTLPATAIADISDPDRRVVAVVLNNIDERLKDVAFPPQGWDLDSLHPISDILDTARSAGRAIVITSDHGHVLDRDTEQRSPGGGGERYKSGDSAPADDELVVTGARVFDAEGNPGGTVTVPWAERVHYGVRRNGYHGGLTPQELLVPLAVMVAGATGEDWPTWPILSPSWWRQTAPVTLPKTTAPSAPAVAEPAEEDDGSRLFDPDSSGPGRLAPAAEWDEAVVAALADIRPPALRISDDEVRRLLRALDSYPGDSVPESRLAETAGLPLARISRYVAQLQQLVNIDGYGVVTAVNGEVRFDRSLLERQLGFQ